MRFWVVTALRYIKSEEITPVELMTANELGSQLTPSARSRHSFCYLYSIEPKSGEWRIKSARLATGPLNEVSERCTR